MDRSAASPKRFDHLEALRGIAAAIVVVYHGCYAFAPTLVSDIAPQSLLRTPLHLLVAGPQAVVFFFVLSGFVVPLAVLRAPGLAPFIKALLKRLPRLYLPAAISVFVGCACLLWLPPLYLHAAAETGSPWLRSFDGAHYAGEAPSFALAARQSIGLFFGGDSTFNSALWTMKAELYGSAVVLVLALLWLIPSRLWRFALLVVLAIPVEAFVYRMDEYLVPFVPGLVLATLIALRRPAWPLWLTLPMGGLGLLLLSFGAPVGIYAWVPTTDFIIPSTAGALLLIAAVHCSPTLSSALGGRIGQILGKLSFPVYLMQTVAVAVLGSAVLLGTRSVDAPLPVATAAAIAAAFAGAVLLALPLMWLDQWWLRALNAATAALFRLPAALRRSLRTQMPASSHPAVPPEGNVSPAT